MKLGSKKAAILLRKEGKSYNEIQSELGIAKSTLSYWLKDLKLSENALIRLNNRSRIGTKALIERNKAQTKKAKQRKICIERSAIKEITQIDLEKLKLIGAALYFGEGGKTPGRVDFTNSNPDTIKIMMKFFRLICKVPDNKFRMQLNIHNLENVAEAKRFWAEITGLNSTNFIKTSISISKYSKKRRRKKLPFGTIQIRISDVKLFHKIMGWIKGSVQQVEKMPG